MIKSKSRGIRLLGMEMGMKKEADDCGLEGVRLDLQVSWVEWDGNEGNRCENRLVYLWIFESNLRKDPYKRQAPLAFSKHIPFDVVFTQTQLNLPNFPT